MRWPVTLVPFSLGLAAAMPAAGAAAAAPGPRGADRAAAAAVPLAFEGRKGSAKCNPGRSRRSTAQLKRTWRCEVTACANATDVERLRAEDLPVLTEGTIAQTGPWTTDAVVEWADGEYEVVAIGEFEWDPVTGKRPAPLGMVTARSLVWSALEQEGLPGRGDAAGYTLRCARRNASRVSCSLRLWVGDARLSGRIQVEMIPERPLDSWQYSWRLRWLDEYCRYVRKRPLARCTKTDVVR